MNEESPYELVYWPGLQGRGELVRLAFEDAGVPYLDIAKGDPQAAVKEIRRLLDGSPTSPSALRPFAPPILRHGSVVLGQAANVLHYLGPRLGLAPDDDVLRHHALQLQLTVTDLFAEVHDTHHPTSSALFYEDQKEAALARTTTFVEHRLPKFLRYFEAVVASRSGAPERLSALGSHSYVDLSFFQVMSGLRHAFPTAMAAIEPEVPGLRGLAERIAARPNIARYLESPRRHPWNLHGIFRAYRELDLAPSWAKKESR